MKHRIKVSADQGKTWKTRWVDIQQMNPNLADVKVGEMLWVKSVKYIVELHDGKIRAVPAKNDEQA